MRMKRPDECAVFVPTYQCYKELAERATDAELTQMLRQYEGMLTRSRSRSTNATVIGCLHEAVRAMEDETLARDYEMMHEAANEYDPFE